MLAGLKFMAYHLGKITLISELLCLHILWTF